jgi:multiple sugar transport system substrate-binding protein
MKPTSMMLSEGLSAEEAAQMAQEAAETWRELSPEMLDYYKQWAEEQGEPSAAPVVQKSEEPEEEVNLEIWWWGCQNVPEYEDYLDNSIAKYQEMHPNVTIEHVCRGTDDTIPAFQGAVQAGEGPDVATEWYGLYMMPDAWSGNLLPLNDYFSEEEISHWTDAWQHTWDGKVWAFAQYSETHPIVFNKKFFEEAGLDPENPPATWEEFLSASAALKDAGIEPLVVGLKDGWIIPPLMIVFAYQDLENGPMDYMAAIAGERSFTEPEYVSFFERMAQLFENDYVNDDAASLGTWEGRQAFLAERGAMNLAAGTTAANWYYEMGSDTVGLMMPPSTGGPVSLDVSSETVMLPVFAENPQAAADFLAYLRTEERLKALNDELGYIPVPDDRFDLDWVEDPVIKELFEWAAEGQEARHMGVDGMVPYSVLAEGFFPAVQLMFTDDLSPEEAAAMVEEAAQNWRDLNPEMLERYIEWYQNILATQ